MRPIEDIRDDFPQLNKLVRGRPLIYFDSAATTLKPKCVIQRLSEFYSYEVANVHRGAHALGDRATGEYEKAREAVQQFLGAEKLTEIVFVRGATEGVNLVASSYLRPRLRAGDEVILTQMDHHSNFVPWQAFVEQTQAHLKMIPTTLNGELDKNQFLDLLNEKVKMVVLPHCSNALGTINDVRFFVDAAHSAGAKVLIDGAQAVSHFPVNVQELGCDFYVFSGHKVFAPFGIGAVFGKEDLLQEMPPYQYGGSMIDYVSLEKTTFLAPPLRFEAGTPPVAEAIALGEALRYLCDDVGLSRVQDLEDTLVETMDRALKSLEGVKVYSQAPRRAPVFSFAVQGMHPLDLATYLDQQGIMVRTGHHCTQPLLQGLNATSLVRASLAFYNTVDEIEAFVEAFGRAKEFLDA